MISPRFRSLAGCLTVLSLARPAIAQTGTTPLTSTQFQLGPLTVQPSIGISNIGRDSNIFNASTGQQGDFTTTVLPAVQFQLPAGPTKLSATTSLEYLYFEHTVGQRSLNFSQTGRIDFVAGRLTPHVEGSWLNTNQRPNPEVDVRVHQHTNGLAAGTLVRIGPDTTLDLTVTRTHLEYADQLFEGVDLGQQLSRTSTSESAAFNYAMTTLTSVVVQADREIDRFPQGAERDSRSDRVLAGFTFKPLAVISGQVLVGYRWFHLLNGGAPPYGGLSASVGASYVLADFTQFQLTLGRDVSYSVDPATPYYVEASAELSVRQALGGRWDGLVRYGRGSLQYYGLAPAVAVDNRRDRTMLAGAGLEYRLTSALSFGFEADYNRRSSMLDDRQYHGYRYGGSFTYGGS